MLNPLLPPGLDIDTFDGSAWVGVIPFWMEGVRTRSFAHRTFAVPGTRTFNELNFRTYVRSRVSGLSGVYFFSLDCDSPPAVFGARTIFHLPYFPARISRAANADTIQYRSQRLLVSTSARYEADYGAVSGSQACPTSRPRTLQYFLTERYCLFTRFAGRILVGHIHHLPWTLHPAKADIHINEIPRTHGVTLPETPPVLHFSKELDVFLWSLEPDRAGTGWP